MYVSPMLLMGTVVTVELKRREHAVECEYVYCREAGPVAEGS
jgi:hypothetical protein